MLHITLTDEVKQTLAALGFTHSHHPAQWEDIGGPENGPKMCGHNAYDMYSKGDTALFVEGGIINGAIVEVEKMQPEPEGFPF